MDNSEQVARAIEALVRLQFAQDAPDADTHMDLDDNEAHQQQKQQQNQVYEAKVAAAQEYSLRILGRYEAPVSQWIISRLRSSKQKISQQYTDSKSNSMIFTCHITLLL